MKKTFFASEFELSLQFKTSGRVLGELKSRKMRKKVTQHLEGLYIRKAITISIVLFANWEFPNVQTIHSVFSGVIRTHLGQERLTLDWLTFSEDEKTVLRKSASMQNKPRIDRTRKHT